MNIFSSNRRYAFPALLALIGISLGTFSFPIPAKAADTSCNVLMTDLSQFLKLSSANRLTMIHMTNYQANGLWFGGYTKTTLRRGTGGHFFGGGSRLLNTNLNGKQPFNINQPEEISYDIDPVNKTIVFNGQFGPYNLTCNANKFALVDSSDSIEVLSFTKGAFATLKSSKKGLGIPNGQKH